MIERSDCCNSKATHLVSNIPFKFDDGSSMNLGELFLCGHHKNKHEPHIATKGYVVESINEE